MESKILKILKNVMLLLGITTIIFLTGCAKKDNSLKSYDKENEAIGQNTTNKSHDSQNQNDLNKVSSNEMLLKDSSKPVVYSYVEVKNDKYQEAPNGSSFSISYIYRIPQININSAAAEAMNKLILDDYEGTYKDYVKNGDSGCCNIDYSYAINGEILSVEISAFWDGGSVQRSAYNINIKNGNEVTHSDLVKQKGILDTEFPSKLSELMTELLKSMYTPSSELTEPDTIEFFNTQYRRSIDIKNCSMGNDMFLNTDNELCVIVERFNLAGPDSTEIIINFDKKIIENDKEA